MGRGIRARITYEGNCNAVVSFFTVVISFLLLSSFLSSSNFWNC